MEQEVPEEHLCHQEDTISAIKKRGRPKKVASEQINDEPPTGSENESQIEMKRFAGRMSLRPNRRVDVTKGYRQLNELIGDNGSEDELEEEDEDFVALAEMPTESDLYPNQGLILVEDLVLPSQSSGSGRQKRRIAFTNHHFKVAKMIPKNDVEKISQVPNVDKSFDFNMNLICVGCAKELDPDLLKDCHKVFEDETPNRTKLYDLLCSVVKDDISETTSGAYICPKCFNALCHIENIYLQFRRASDTFLDTYILGHKLLNADFTSSEVIEDSFQVIDTVPLQDCVLVILNNDLSNFKIPVSDPGKDHFGCTIEVTYSGCILKSDLIPPNCYPISPTDGDATVTITFDYSTGIIEKALGLNVAELSKSDLNSYANIPKFYMTSNEFNSIHRYVGDKRVNISRSEINKLQPILIANSKSGVPMLMSSQISDQYFKKVPKSDHSFYCFDCGSSFRFFDKLSNHIQTLHCSEGESQSEIVSAQNVMEVGQQIMLNKDVHPATRERPTLAKPFQCQSCGKCFSHYQNLSNHSDHYHGFRRICNFQGCQFVGSSIQEFVQHYLNHNYTPFSLPSTFEEKKKAILPCPICSQQIQGIWKFFQHTYTHDSEPRFECPVCDKRTSKVQNFKEHLAKHLESDISKSKTCRYCKEEIPGLQFDRHLRAHRQQSHLHQCDQCSLAFSTESKLLLHQEKHTRSSNCDVCSRSFDNEMELNLHRVNDHSAPTCSDCGEVCPTQDALDLHARMIHDVSQLLLFQCLACNKKEKSLLAARKHYRKEHKDKPFTCIKCKNSYPTEVLLHVHLTETHPETVNNAPLLSETVDYPCAYCKKIFNRGSLRMRHTRFHHLVESIEVSGESVMVTEDHILEFDKETGGVIRLHSIP